MNVRWLWFDLIPQELELTREQRRRVRAEARDRDDRLYWKTLLVLIPWFLLYVVWLFWLYDLVFSEPLGHSADMVQAVTFILVAHLIAAVVFRQARIRHVREVLRRHGFDVCLSCGYWLRGLDGDVSRCPECGGHREPMPAADT